MGYKFITVIGFATLAFIAGLILLGIVCLCYLISFRRKYYRKNLLVLSDFHSLWIVRLLLILFASLWALTECFRLPVLRYDGWILHHLSHNSQSTLCRLHALVSMGMLEPSFYLTTFYLLNFSTTEPHVLHLSHRFKNFPLLVRLVSMAFPVFSVQFILTTLLPAMGIKEGLDGSVPTYFTRTYVSRLDSPMQGCKTTCTYSLLSCIVLSAFALPYMCLFMFTCWKMLNFALNQKLRKRILLLEGILLILLPIRVSFLVFSSISEPESSVLEILAFPAFLSNVLFFASIETLLILLPLLEAMAAIRTVERKERFTEMSDTFTDDEDFARQGICSYPLISNGYRTLASFSHPNRTEFSGQVQASTSAESFLALNSSAHASVGNSNALRTKAEFVPAFTVPSGRYGRKKSKGGRSVEDITLMGSEDYSHPLMYTMNIESSIDASVSSFSMNKYVLNDDVGNDNV